MWCCRKNKQKKNSNIEKNNPTEENTCEATANRKKSTMENMEKGLGDPKGSAFIQSIEKEVNTLGQSHCWRYSS